MKRYLLTRHSVFFILTLFLATGCATSRVKSLTDAGLQHQADIAKQYVSDHYQTDFSTIVIQPASEQRIARVLRDEGEAMMEEQYQGAWYVAPMMAYYSEIFAEGILGKYRSKKNDILINTDYLAELLDPLHDKPALVEQATQGLLVHELIHAVHDHQYDTDTMTRNITFSAMAGYNAVSEGYAEQMTEVICKANGCLEGYNALNKLIDEYEESKDPYVASIQRSSSSSYAFTYGKGKAFIAALHKKGGDALVQKALSKPPQGTLQVYFPERFPDHVREDAAKRLEGALPGLHNAFTQRSWVIQPISPLGWLRRSTEEKTRERLALIDGAVAAQMVHRSDLDSHDVDVLLLQAKDATTAKALYEAIEKGATSRYQGLEGDSINIDRVWSEALPLASPQQVDQSRLINQKINYKKYGQTAFYRDLILVHQQYVMQISIRNSRVAVPQIAGAAAQILHGLGG